MYPIINENSQFDAVIVCDGDFPTHAIPLSVLKHATFLCCCDGAASHCIDQGIIPHAIVGDGDSLPAHYKHKYAHLLHLFSEQDYNDQTKATRYCKSLGYKRIAYIGSTGKREDHTLGNISLMARYHHVLGLDVTLITNYGYLYAVSGRQRFASFKGQQISLFNIGNCTQLESEGLKWKSYPYTELWQGTLNEAIGDEFEINADGTYLVFSTFDAKRSE